MESIKLFSQGRPTGSLAVPREPSDAAIGAERITVISCFYEDKIEWGKRVGCIASSITEDVVTGYRMHNTGWRSVYCVTNRDALRGTTPIYLIGRLHQVGVYTTLSGRFWPPNRLRHCSMQLAIFRNHTACPMN
jgi:hypothetical protein